MNNYFEYLRTHYSTTFYGGLFRENGSGGLPNNIKKKIKN